MIEDNRDNRGRGEEPEEIVSWYTPDETPREVVRYYHQDTPLPGRACPRPEPAPKKSRRGLWIFLICLAVLIAVVTAAAILFGGSGEGGGHQLPSDGDSASSIIDIFQEKKTTIPRVEGDPSVRMTCTDYSGVELTPQQVYAKVNPSVVTVVAVENDEGSASVGTGVILTEDGYILTNAHVISGGKSCWIALDSGATCDAKLVGYDEEEDLAVLKAETDGALPAAEIGNSDQCRVGDTVYAIGNPLGVELRGTFTDGIISAINREVELEGKTMTLIQTNAALNNGNSGGPLINAYGQVIGINTLKMSGTGSESEATVEGLGFALPTSSACFVVNDLIACGEFRGTPTIGIQVVTAEYDGGTRLKVYSVEPGFGAEEAGLQENDILLAANGQPLSTTGDLMAVRRTLGVGDTIHLSVLRDGQRLEFDVVLYSNRAAG